MVKFEKLGMILKPVDRLHAKFNTGALLLGDKVHLLYRWAEIPEQTGGFGPKYLQNYVAYAQMTPEGKLLRDGNCILLQEVPRFGLRTLKFTL